MSTRAVVNFYDTWDNKKFLTAKVYRHSDGYPEGLGADLNEFLKIIKEHLTDTRFDDASYLAAKWVVFDSQRGRVVRNKVSMLNFLGVGLLMKDPGDIEYSYDVVCSSRGGVPKITHRKVRHK